MIVLITLPIAGPSTGPFSLYSDVDGYTTPFEIQVPKPLLVAGYTSALVPAGTTIIQVRSLGTCTNSVNIPINLLNASTTTTSTSTTTAPTTTTTTVPTTTTTSSTTTSTSTTTVPTTTTSTTTVAPMVLELYGPCNETTEYVAYNAALTSLPGVYTATNGFPYEVVSATPVNGTATVVITDLSNYDNLNNWLTINLACPGGTTTTSTSTTTTVAPTTTTTTTSTTTTTEAPTTTTTTQAPAACSELEIYPPLTPGTTHTVVFLTCEWGTQETINIPYGGTMGSICVQPGGVISDNGASVNAQTSPTFMVCIGNTTTTTTTTTTAPPANNYSFFRCSGTGIASVVVSEAALVNAGMAPGAILNSMNTIEITGSGNLDSCYSFDTMTSASLTGVGVVSFNQCTCLDPA